MKRNYLAIEAPDQTATIDFLHLNANVRITHSKEDNALEITVRVSDSEDSSYFTVQDFYAPLALIP